MKHLDFQAYIQPREEETLKVKFWPACTSYFHHLRLARWDGAQTYVISSMIYKTWHADG